MTASRALAYLAFSWAALVVLGAVRALLPLGVAVPDPALVVVAHLGLTARGPAASLLGVALAIGYLADLVAGAPRGLHVLSLGLVALATRAASSRLLVDGAWQEVVITFLIAVAHGLIVVALSSPMYDGQALAAIRLVPGSALASAALAPLLRAIFRRLDRRLHPEPRGLRWR